MAERKLVKHGPSTFMVSLPKRWIDKHKFQKGDSIKYEERPDSITFFAREKAPEAKSIEADFTGLDRSFIMFYLRALYRQGYREITIKFKSPVVTHHRSGKQARVSSIVMEEVRRLIGIEISSHSKNSIVLKQLAEPTLDELKPSLRRVFFLLNGTYEELIEALENNDFEALETLEDKHDAIAKLASYCIRVLHVTYHKDNRPYLMHALMQLDEIIDVLKYFARQVRDRKTKMDGKSVKPVRDLYKLHSLVESLFFNWDNSKANEFDRIREEIKDASWTAGSADQVALTKYLEPLLETYRDLILTRLSIPGELFKD